VVLFGEALGGAYEDATDDLARADLLLVLGSSLEVAPVSEMVPFAAARKIPVAIVNREATACDDDATLLVHGELAPTMRALRALV
jgi:NAD-dependent SIR2 family protein deacetylase